ncbi:MAG TPA: hypothetical protein VGD26_04720, partial [Chitinophagaceae bacterium]
YNWDDFLVLSRELKQNDLFVIISSRKNNPSYNQYLEKLPYYLSNYFSDNSFIVLYPRQLEYGIRMDDIQHIDSDLIETIAEPVNKAGSYIKNLFGKKPDQQD